MKSTEQTLNILEGAAEEVRKRGKKVVVASMDVVGLYPNLEIEKSPRLCGVAASETDVELVNANWEWAVNKQGRVVKHDSETKEEEWNKARAIPGGAKKYGQER